MTDIENSQINCFSWNFMALACAATQIPRPKKISRKYKANMRIMQRKIPELLALERSRWVLWAPVFFGIGIGFYFALPFEPKLSVLALFAAIFLLFCTITVVRKMVYWPFFAVFALLSSGALTAAYRAESVAAPILQSDISFTTVQGIVDEIIPREKDTKIILSNVRIERLAEKETPARVSLTLRGTAHADTVKQGDEIRLNAVFFPPPQAAYPEGYQFNRHYYFQRIGATGYSFGTKPPEVIRSAADTDGFFGEIARLRTYIFSLFMKEMGAEAGSVAAALTMGEQRAIPAHVFDAMRDSGLAHILSISGLHMALAAGIFFVLVRVGLSLVPALALRFNTKKIAAFFALLGALAYLFLSGWPIPAQRSYLMIALVLLAVLFDRQVTPMRSLALAAMLVLLFLPESLLNPSFQLSFAATVALVAYYEYRRERNNELDEQTGKRRHRFLRYWLDIIVTSMVATLATAPFILFHFAGFPIYSVLGNLLTLALVSFWIMPLIVLILLLLPFGMETWLITPLKYGVMAMVRIGEWVSSLPHAVIDIPPLPIGSIALCALGGLWLCLWQQRWRHFGWIAMALSFASLFFYAPPDMIISEDGKKIALRSGQESMVMLRGRPEGFQQEQWVRFARIESFGKVQKTTENSPVKCDALACVYGWNDKAISIVEEREALLEDCADSDMVITPDWSVYGVARTHCAANIRDRRGILRDGATAFWLTDDGIISRSVREVAGQRPWSRGGVISRK